MTYFNLLFLNVMYTFSELDSFVATQNTRFNKQRMLGTKIVATIYKI